MINLKYESGEITIMKTITLNFRDCKYFEQVHDVLKEAFDFPEYYGRNLSALWDCLDDYCENDTKIIITGIKEMPEESQEYMQKILNIFKRLNTKNISIIYDVV